MEKIRIGKDITFRWIFHTVTGDPIDLSDRNLQLEIKNIYTDTVQLPFEVNDNIITAKFMGTEQKKLGVYSLTLWENRGMPGQNAVDCINAFKLVPNTDLEDFASKVHNLILDVVGLETGMMITVFGGGGADTEFDGVIGGGAADTEFDIFN